MLIHYGGSINASDNDGNTPIHLATANGHEKVRQYASYPTGYLLPEFIVGQ